MSDVAIAIPLIVATLGLGATVALTVRNVRRGRTPVELLGHASLGVMATLVFQAVGILCALVAITITTDLPIPRIDQIQWIPTIVFSVVAWGCLALAAMALIRQQRASAGEQKTQWRRPWFALALIACIVRAFQWAQLEIGDFVAEARHAIYYENSQIAFRAVTEPESVNALRSREGLPLGDGIRSRTPQFGDIGCFVEMTGHVRCLVRGANGKIVKNDIEGLEDVVAIASSLEQACAIERDGRLSCWSVDDDAKHGRDSGSWKSQRIADIRAKQVSVADTHACAMDEAGKVYCWGSNQWGELCDGTRVDRVSPVAAIGVSDATMVSVENSVTCIVRRTGDVACCGMQRRRW